MMPMYQKHPRSRLSSEPTDLRESSAALRIPGESSSTRAGLLPLSFIASIVVFLGSPPCFAPNEMTASPEGGESVVPPGALIGYSVHFEHAGEGVNVRRLLIDVILDEDLDWTTVRFLRICMEAPVPDGTCLDLQAFNSRDGVSLETDLGVPIVQGNDVVRVADVRTEIRGIVDLDVGIVRWILETHDPDPLVGFLPPNDEKGRGQGFASFSVRARDDLAEGTEIAVYGTLRFDESPAVITSSVIHTVSRFLPEVPDSPFPPDGATAVGKGTTLCWGRVPTADTYDLFLWEQGETRPTTPAASDIEKPCWAPPFLKGRTRYLWQVNSKNPRGTTQGPIWSFLTAGGFFQRGDADGTGFLDITDAIYTLAFLFLGAPPPPCAKAADANDDGRLDITDPVAVLNFLFIDTTQQPPEPFETCGPDMTEDTLSCAEFPACE